MNVRFPAALALVGALCFPGAAAAQAEVAPPPHRAPHIILILADDLGWNDVGYHGSEIRTPRIDALAEQGVVLDRFYAFPTCTPTRVALLTGRSPLTLGMHGPLEPGEGGIPLDERMLPEMLRDAGYQTYMAGKWHLGSGHVRYWPQNRGFDQYYGNLTGGIGYWDKIHHGQYDWQRNGKTERDERNATDLIVDEAVRVLRERDKARPVFLYASFTAPHAPTEAPDEDIARYAAIENPVRRTHAAMVDRLDGAIGRILDELETQGMADDALVIFLSDNGGAVPEIVRPWLRWLIPDFRTWGSDNAPLRGGKTDVFDGGMRVPGVLHWPGVLEGGRTVEGRVTALDLLPTLAEALGFPLPDAKPLHGQSRWDVIAQGAATPPQDFVAGNMASFAYFRGPWKLVEAVSPLPFAKPSGTFLFRIEEDPSERNDLAAQHPEVVKELQAALAAFPKTESDWVLPKPWEMGLLFGGEETGAPIAESALRD
jgi:arylsulfatase A-like enzyme